jgi:hypothetical protein
LDTFVDHIKNTEGLAAKLVSKLEEAPNNKKLSVDVCLQLKDSSDISDRKYMMWSRALKESLIILYKVNRRKSEWDNALESYLELKPTVSKNGYSVSLAKVLSIMELLEKARKKGKDLFYFIIVHRFPY